MTQIVAGAWPATGPPIDPSVLDALLAEFDEYYPVSASPGPAPVVRGPAHDPPPGLS